MVLLLDVIHFPCREQLFNNGGGGDIFHQNIITQIRQTILGFNERHQNYFMEK